MLLSLFLSFVAYLALRCVHNPVNCPSVICSPRIAGFIIFWERDITSEHHVSRSISSSLFTRSFTFLLLLSVAIIISCVWSFVNNKTGEIDNLSELRWEQSYLCLCAGPRQLRHWHLIIISGVLLVDTQPRYLHRGKLAATLHLTFHLG